MKAIDTHKDELKKIAKDLKMDVSRGSEAGNSELKEPVSTGVEGLDFILGGGLFFGRMYEIFGEEAAGKSTLTYHMMTQFQKAYADNGVLQLLESESAIDKDRAQHIGVDLDNLLMSEPDCFEDGVNLISRTITKLRETAPELRMMVDWDTITVAPTRQELENTTKGKFIGSGMAEKPRLMSMWLKTATKFFSQNKVIVILVSQVRDKIGSYGGGVDSVGGHAMKHYATVRLYVRRGAAIMQDERLVGHKVRLVLEKSKQSPPHNWVEVDHYFNGGFDGISSIQWFAKTYGIFDVRSNGITFIPGIEKSFRSAATVIESMKQDKDLYHYVCSLCYQYMYRAYPTLVNRLVDLEKSFLEKSGKYSSLKTTLKVSALGGVSSAAISPDLPEDVSEEPED